MQPCWVMEAASNRAREFEPRQLFRRGLPALIALAGARGLYLGLIRRALVLGAPPALVLEDAIALVEGAAGELGIEV